LHQPPPIDLVTLAGGLKAPVKPGVVHSEQPPRPVTRRKRHLAARTNHLLETILQHLHIADV